MPQAKRCPEANSARRALSIRARLLVLAAISLLPLVLDRFRDIEIDRIERIETVTQQALDFARQGVAAQNEVIVSARAVLQVAAGAYGMIGPDRTACSRFLSDTLRHAPWFRNLSVADPNGIIVCSSTPSSVGRDVSATPPFRQAKVTGEFTLGGYYSTPHLGHVVAAAMPHLSADDTLDAVLLGPIELKWFERIASSLAQRSNAVVMMFDGNGTMLARHPDTAHWAGRSFPEHATLRQMLAQTEGNYTGDDLNGVRRIFGFAQLPGVHARLAVGFDERAVLAGARRAIWAALGQLGFIAALMLIAIWFGGERLIIEPIRALTRAAQRYGRGETGPHTIESPAWAKEFVPLAAALDDMAGQLAAREQDLRANNAHLQELANVDALTDLANRRTFDARLAAEWQSALAGGQPIAVLMIDVDHFKLFNDRYGHVRGDRCLRQLAKAIVAGTRFTAAPDTGLAMPPSYRGAGRTVDFVARYGGEEFIALLPGATLETATDAAERLRKSIEDLKLEHEAAPRGYVTISVGVASMVPAKGEDPLRLTESADAALYAAKHIGRNAVAREPDVTLYRAS